MNLNAHFHAGGDDNLAVIMGAYKSPSAIQCQGKMNYPQNCIKVLDNMPATKNREVFGIGFLRTTTVAIPQDLLSGTPTNQPPFPFPVCHFLTDYRIDDGKCVLNIAPLSVAPTVKASWYEMWEATVAISSLCARRSLEGSLSWMSKFSTVPDRAVH